MKMRKSPGSFLKGLKRGIRSLRHMKPGETHIISVHANYGHYQIVIGPGNSEKRPIEINGEIHHLFMTTNSISAQPSKRQMLKNLKDTIIMRELQVHLSDPKGDGRHLEKPAEKDERVHIRECINMAGRKGEEIIEESCHSNRLPMAAYRIIQNDVLRALQKRSEDTVEDVTAAT